jgi:copper oxidase (laccase) domain-containing protein
MARIAGKAALALCEEAQVGADQLVAYVGPHIGRADYEVSPELAERFREEFGCEAADDEHHVDLTFCVRSALEDVGVRAEAIAASEDSTAAQTQRYYSYRAEGGSCGRHGALAFMRSAG